MDTSWNEFRRSGRLPINPPPTLQSTFRFGTDISCPTQSWKWTTDTIDYMFNDNIAVNNKVTDLNMLKWNMWLVWADYIFLVDFGFIENEDYLCCHRQFVIKENEYPKSVLFFPVSTITIQNLAHVKQKVKNSITKSMILLLENLRCGFALTPIDLNSFLKQMLCWTMWFGLTPMGLFQNMRRVAKLVMWPMW